MADGLVVKELLNVGIFSISIYCFYSYGSSILREITKFVKKLKFITNFKSNVNSNIENLAKIADKEYVIIWGRAKKLFSRYGNYINNKIIISESNTTYYEDFVIDVNNKIRCLIQAYPGTRFHNLTRNYLSYPKSKFEKVLYKIFYTQSQTLKDGDNIFIFGKINKNILDVTSKFQDMINIKAKEITAESLDRLISKIKEKHVNHLINKFLFFTLAGLVLYYQLRYYFWPKVKRSATTIKQRTRIYCKGCTNEPCNVMCEKCWNLSEYCDGCYTQLQDRIDKREMKLEDIKCLFCGGVLDCCQRLFNANQ